MPMIEIPANINDVVYHIHRVRIRNSPPEYHIHKSVVGAVHIGRRLYLQSDEPTDTYVRLINPVSGYHSDRIRFDKFHDYCFSTYEEAVEQVKKFKKLDEEE